MKATIWASTFVMPTQFCVNCWMPASSTVKMKSEGGIASTHGSHSLIVLSLAALASGAAQNEAPYCSTCIAEAEKKPPEIALTTILFGFLWLFAVVLLWEFQTHNVTFAMILFVMLVILGLFGAWFRHQREPPTPPRTTKWRAFAILNAGKDLFRGNKPFVKIEFTNPKLLEELHRVNPGVDIS
jgi:hypothetical protein